MDAVRAALAWSRPDACRMHSTGSLSAAADRELVARAAIGDERAVSELYDRYATVVYTVAYRIVGQRADADEVVVETFAQAWRDAARFEASRGSVAAWLTTIARSRALDLVRARGRRERLAASAAVNGLANGPVADSGAAAPADRAEDEERRRMVRHAIDTLSPPQRQAIELAFYEGLSQSEIADRLNEPLGTVKTRVRLGMQKLRDALRPYFFERVT
jgi:RNA polymerase sigma-70 factor (ECF subfamily)